MSVTFSRRPWLNHLEVVFLQMRLAFERDLLAVGRAERDALYTEVAERGHNAAEGGREGYRVLGL